MNERRTSHTLITNICFRNVRLHRDDTYPYTLDHTAIPHFHALFPSTHDGRSFPVCSRPQVLGTPACDPQAPRVCAHYKKATGAVSSWFTYMPVISFPGVQPAQVPHPVSTEIGQVLSPPAGVLAGDVYRAPGGGRKTLWAPGADGVDTLCLLTFGVVQAHSTTAGMRERKRTVKGAPGRYNGRVLRYAVGPV